MGPRAAWLMLALGTWGLAGCGGDGAKVQGSLAARSGAGLTNGLVVTPHALRFDGVRIDLLRVGSGDDPTQWSKVGSATASEAGSFAFDEVEPGRYALRLEQPEFGQAFAADSTDFRVDEGDTVQVVLPLYTGVSLGPLLTGSTAMAIEAASGRIHLATHGGWAVVDPDGGTAGLLRSRALWQQIGAIAVLPSRKEVLFIGHQRLIRAPLAALAPGQTIDFDDLATRQKGVDGLTWAAIPEKARIGQGLGFTAPNSRRTAWISADESTVYLAYAGVDMLAGEPSGRVVQVIDVASLAVVRTIQGAVLAFNASADRLYFGSPQGGGNEVLVVDAAARKDVGAAQVEGQIVGVAAVPGNDEALVISKQTTTADAEVAFVTKIGADAKVLLPTTRLREFLGISDDPPVGLPGFAADGTTFVVGGRAFAKQGEGFRAIAVQIPPGGAFRTRLACATERAFDPVAGYEIWHGSASALDPCPWVGLVPLDQKSVPVAIRASFGQLDAARGRVVETQYGSLGLLHYADVSAAARPEVLDLTAVGAGLVAADVVCSESQPCPDKGQCAGASDTAFTGTCVANPAEPYRALCGGLTELGCDPGRTCTLTNPTNPKSNGTCSGLGSRDFAAEGPSCGASEPCPFGMACNAGGHCEPKTCLLDADCAAGEVCGMVASIGRVCVAAGVLPAGAICLQTSDCATGACVEVPGQPAPMSNPDAPPHPSLRTCVQPCFATSACATGEVCALAPGQEFGDSPWPLPFCRAATDAGCDPACGAAEICLDGGCGIGVNPAALPLGQPESARCLPPWQMNVWNNCSITCKRNSDCPWPADCLAGTCGVSSKDRPADAVLCAAGKGCAATEMCADFRADVDAPKWTCMDADPCQSDADCGKDAACNGTCAALCETTAGCPSGQECTAHKTWNQLPVQQCYPPFCGCTGPAAAGALCRYDDLSCHLPRPCALACDETNPDTACRPDDPEKLAASGTCRCPACAWNGTACNTACPPNLNCPAMPVQACPADYTCTLVSGQKWGASCACTGPSCQN